MSRNPFQPDQRVEIHIDKLAARGYGLGRVRNIVFFVPHTVPGDRIVARVTRRHRSYNFAVCERLLAPSILRVDPVCPHFTRCGGCALLNMEYGQQLSWKRAVLMEQLRNIPLEIQSAVPSPPHQYRNKLMMRLQCRDGRLFAGYHAHRSHEVVEIFDCRLQTVAVNRLKERFLGLAREILTVAEQECLRSLMIRCNRAGELQLVVVAGRELAVDAWIERLQESEPGLVSAGLFLNDDPDHHGFQRGAANRFAGDPWRWVTGQRTLLETVAGQTFHLAPENFFQVNLYQLETMVERVREMAGDGGVLVDLYAGAGFFGRTLGDRFADVHLVEISPAAEESFRASRPDPEKFHYHCGDAGRIATGLAAGGLKVDCLVVDPPRAGMSDEAISAVTTLRPRRLVMVSCNPSTLARDLERLQQVGFCAGSLVPVDNFPQTEHLEVICRLTREDSAARMEETDLSSERGG